MKLLVKDIQKNYSELEVLKDCSYEFESGKIYGLLGRNGSGKTTLFNIIYGDLDYDNGSIEIEENNSVNKIKTKDIGMVFAENILPEFLTGYEFIKFYKDINGSLDDEKTVDEYLDMVNFSQKDRHRIINDYSSGMKSKISLLTLFISKPKVILLDEPLTSVDVVVGQQIKALLRALKKEHIVIVSTHMLELATSLCDDIVLLNNGKLSELDKHKKEEENFEAFIIEILKDGGNNE